MRLARLNTKLSMWNANLSQCVLVQAGTMVQVESTREQWLTIYAPGGLVLTIKTNDVYADYVDFLDGGPLYATSNA